MVVTRGDERFGAPVDRGPRRGAAGRHDPAADVAAARGGLQRTNPAYGTDAIRAARRRPARRVTPVDRVRGFVRRYGWRAYAVPVLAVVTVLALLSSTSPPKSGAVAERHHAAPVPAGAAQHDKPAPVAPAQLSLKPDAPGADAVNSIPAGYALPRGGAYTRHGTGTFRTVPGTSAVIGKGPLHTYSIDVENGITGIDLTQYANTVQRTLADPRSWAGHGVSLQRVDSGPVDFRVTLTSSYTVRNLCGYEIHVATSCYAPAKPDSGVDVNRVVFNDARWVRGSTAYLGDLATYRIYMINHEDGHALGHEHAHECLPGGLAPVMMQQTFGLRSAQTGRLCQANPWPYPTNAAGAVYRGAPGAEQQDTPANDEYGLGD